MNSLLHTLSFKLNKLDIILILNSKYIFLYYFSVVRATKQLKTYVFDSRTYVSYFLNKCDIMYTWIIYINILKYNLIIQDPSKRVSEFTQQDINDGKIMFRHRGSNFGRILIWVNDGQLWVSTELKVRASKPFVKITNNTGLIVQR